MSSESFPMSEAAPKCECEFRMRQWDPNTAKCRTCSRHYQDTRAVPPPTPRPRTITIPPKEIEALVGKLEPSSASDPEISVVADVPLPEPARTPTRLVQVTNRNHLPAEMAARLLEQQGARKYDDPTPEQDEACTLLAEECAKAIQRATKIQRFGLGARPGDTVTNVRALSEELGHVQAAIDMAVQHGVADSRHIMLARARKLEDYARAPESGGVTRRQSVGVRKSLALMAEILFDRLTRRKPTKQ